MESTKVALLLLAIFFSLFTVSLSQGEEAALITFSFALPRGQEEAAEAEAPPPPPEQPQAPPPDQPQAPPPDQPQAVQAPATAASNTGRWKLLTHNLGISAMHMVVLPTGKVVAFDRTDFGLSNISLPNGRCRDNARDTAAVHDCTAHAVELDPTTRAVRPLFVQTDTFCSSGTLSPNGTLVQTGGYNDGDRAVRYLSTCDTCDWIEEPTGLVNRRWYSTNHNLPDGRAIVIGGRGQFNYEFVPKASTADRSVFQLPFLVQTNDPWENNLYPFVFLNTDGFLFVFANTKSILLDYKNNRVVRTYPEMPGNASRSYPSTGSAVLLPLQLGQSDGGNIVRAEVMICGGTPRDSYPKAKDQGVFQPATNTCGRLVITDPSPGWAMSEMPMARMMGDMLLLPNGDVLIVNGMAKGSAGWTLGREPVLHPLLYRTGATGPAASGGFEVMAPSAIPRAYHSTAVLVPDGRVLVAGSNPNVRYAFTKVLFPTELRVEAFSPPYLQPAAGGSTSLAGRPTIAGVAPGLDVGYGKTLSVTFKARKGTGAAAEGVAVTMLAPPFTTHSWAMGQRMLVLAMEGQPRTKGSFFVADVLSPATNVLAPPGYYMLFVVQDGVPSRGRWIHIA